MNTWVKDINYICQAPATAYTRAGVAHDWHVASSLTAASTRLHSTTHSHPGHWDLVGPAINGP